MAPATMTPRASPTVTAGAVDPAIAAKGYVHPDVLVTTTWLAQHLDDPHVRVLESDEDVLLYDSGHVPGAQKIDWHEDLNDPVVRDYLSVSQFQSLLRRLGIDDTTTVVFYGDKNNWWAAYAFWVFQLFGFTNVALLDGGRSKWESESRPMTTDVPRYPATRFEARERSDEPIRAFSPDVRRHLAAHGQLVDVRSPQSTPASGCTCRTTRRKARCAADTFPAPRASRGHAPPTLTAHLRRRPSCEPSTKRNRVSSPATM